MQLDAAVCRWPGKPVLPDFCTILYTIYQTCEQFCTQWALRTFGRYWVAQYCIQAIPTCAGQFINGHYEIPWTFIETQTSEKQNISSSPLRFTEHCNITHWYNVKAQFGHWNSICFVCFFFSYYFLASFSEKNARVRSQASNWASACGCIWPPYL